MLTIDLTGRVALVVGGSRGIGRAISETLARAGASVTLTHTGNPQYCLELQAFCDNAKRQGLQLDAVAVDACSQDGMAACVDQLVAAHGNIDILVHNAGKNTARPAEDLRLAEWQAGIELNLTAAYISVHAVLPHMLRARHGRVLLIGSSAVTSGGGGAMDYAAAKAGLVGLMTYLAKDYTRKGILTNVIHPCVIETELLRERYSDQQAKATLLAQIPAGRLGQPADIAGLVAYLASPWGDYICGQAILVDGGRTIYR